MTESTYGEVEIEAVPSVAVSPRTNTTRNTSTEINETNDTGDESMTDVSSGLADPFKPRDGRNLVWRDVNVTVKQHGSEPEKKILDRVWGEVGYYSGSGTPSLIHASTTFHSDQMVDFERVY